MSTRVQVILDKHEKQALRAVAAREGMSLSAWLRKCALERLEESASKTTPSNLEQLRAFFQACDEREQGDEPDWLEHKRIIERSSTSGISET